MNEAQTPKKSKKLKPNIIDLLLVIVVIGAIAGIALRAGIVDKVVNNVNVEPARISFAVYDINNDSYDYFIVGDSFYSDTHGYIGSLESKPIDRAAEGFITGYDGLLIKTESPSDPENPQKNDRIDVFGELIGSGVFSEEGFLLGGTNYIAPGSQVKLESKNITVSATITDIEPVNSAE